MRLASFKSEPVSVSAALRRMLSVGLCGLGLLCSGCQSDVTLVPVRGTVLLDGEPLADVLVTFIPDSAHGGRPIRSMGISDHQGEFQLRAETQAPGAVVGEHRVMLEDLSILNAPRSEDGTVMKLPPVRFPNRYANPLSSKLRVTVNQSHPTILLELSSELP